MCQISFDENAYYVVLVKNGKSELLAASFNTQEEAIVAAKDCEGQYDTAQIYKGMPYYD